MARRLSPLVRICAGKSSVVQARARARFFSGGAAIRLCRTGETEMRTNMPVTNREYVLHDGQTVVSKTDLKGNITYVNQDFIDISGFSAEELIGAPQNIVRHPDMPAEAFADFWRTIKSGKAWTGMVKNRCKNGDYYWVEANAAPMLENGKMVGYTSIRVKPSREQVAAAEQAYRAIKSGSKAIEVREGAAVPRSSLRRLNLLARLSLRARMALVFGVLALWKFKRDQG